MHIKLPILRSHAIFCGISRDVSKEITADAAKFALNILKLVLGCGAWEVKQNKSP